MLTGNERPMLAARCCKMQSTEQEDPCEGCPYHGSRYCMSDALADFEQLCGELNQEILALRACKLCDHYKVCHLIFLHQEGGDGDPTPCEHWTLKSQ